MRKKSKAQTETHPASREAMRVSFNRVEKLVRLDQIVVGRAPNPLA